MCPPLGPHSGRRMSSTLTFENNQFGTLSVDEDKIITFPEGIIGFEDLKRYVIRVVEEYEPFQWLISVEDREVIFPVLSPKLVREDYAPRITRDHLSGIGEYEDEDLLLYLIVTFNAESQEATANLKGPLFINQQTRRGRQVVIESDEYPLKYVFM